MAEVWYVELQDGSVSGPMPEKRICEDLLAGKIAPDLRVRQGLSGPWCPASRARDLFRQLTENGWYIQAHGETFGPFTPDRLLELHNAGEIAIHAKLRQGPNGVWKEAEAMFAVWTKPAGTEQAQPPEEPMSGPIVAEPHNSKWRVEPIRHYLLPLEHVNPQVARNCKPFERLFLYPTEVSGDDRLVATRSNHQDVGSLNLANSNQLLSNREKGIRHIALFSATASGCEIIIVLCPPGTPSRDCRQHIDTHFNPNGHETV